MIARRARLQRHARLARTAWRRAATALTRRAPARREPPAPAVPDDVRAQLAARSGGWCEIALIGCWGRATDPHHRITVKAGGRHGEARVAHNRLSNLLHACRPCHDWVTARPAEAYDSGWSLREGQDTAREPVVRRGAVVYLDDAGGIQDGYGQVPW